MGYYEDVLKRERAKNEAKAERRARREKKRLQARWLRDKAAKELFDLEKLYDAKADALYQQLQVGIDACYDELQRKNLKSDCHWRCDQIYLEGLAKREALELAHQQQLAKTPAGLRYIRMKCAELERKRQPEIDRAWAEMDYGRADRLIKERDAEVAALKENCAAHARQRPNW